MLFYVVGRIAFTENFIRWKNAMTARTKKHLFATSKLKYAKHIAKNLTCLNFKCYFIIEKCLTKEITCYLKFKIV